MSAVNLLKNSFRYVLNAPPVHAFRKRLYRQRFFDSREWQGLHFGIFESFEEAQLYLAGNTRAGYVLDLDWYLQNTAIIEIFDYPVILWLRDLIASGASVFDFGGSVGVSYYNYAKFIDYPGTMEWVVCEQPEVTNYGENLSVERGTRHLSFVNDIGQASGRDIFFSAGCLQFVSTPLAKLLKDLSHPPSHLLLNKLPLYELTTRATLQNTGQSISPSWLFNRAQFICELEDLGYHLVDAWACPGRSVRIRFDESHNVPVMSGLYFRREDNA